MNTALSFDHHRHVKPGLRQSVMKILDNLVCVDVFFFFLRLLPTYLVCMTCSIDNFHHLLAIFATNGSWKKSIALHSWSIHKRLELVIILTKVSKGAHGVCLIQWRQPSTEMAGVANLYNGDNIALFEV